MSTEKTTPKKVRSYNISQNDWDFLWNSKDISSKGTDNDGDYIIFTSLRKSKSNKIPGEDSRSSAKRYHLGKELIVPSGERSRGSGALTKIGYCSGCGRLSILKTKGQCASCYNGRNKATASNRIFGEKRIAGKEKAKKIAQTVQDIKAANNPTTRFWKANNGGKFTIENLDKM